MSLWFLRCYLQATAPSGIYTLSLHDALPISHLKGSYLRRNGASFSDRATMIEYLTRHGDYLTVVMIFDHRGPVADRKSTRLNSSHITSSYAVFCLKKKNCVSQRARRFKPCGV